jgi:outer membrane protein TolC
MKVKIFLVLFFGISLYGQNLSEILQALKNSEKVSAIQENLNSNIANVERFGAQEAPELGFGISNTDEDTDKGIEYSIGIHQNISYPFSSKEDVVKEDVNSINQELKYKLNILSLDVASKYHFACISKEMSNMAKSLYKEQESRFSKLELLHEVGEISRKDLLFNKLDLVKLKQKVSSYKMDYLSGLGELQKMIDSTSIYEISCDDLEIIKRDIKLYDLQNHAEIKKIQHMKNSAKKQYDLYGSFFTSLSYEFLYEKELGAKRYTVGLSIPLNSLSSKHEKERSEYLYKNAYLSAQENYLTSEIKKDLDSSKAKIKTIYEQFSLLNKEILPMSLELKKLSKTALDEGEGTIMEYLDATRSYSENVLEMLEIKQDYYNELFDLYKKADIDLGEKS